MRAVVEEPQGTAARCGVVYDLGNHRLVVAEIELVADTYLAGRLHEHIPQLVLGAQLAKQEHLYLGACLLLVAIEESGEYHRVVIYEEVAVVKKVDYLLEFVILYCPGLAVYHHQSGVVALGVGMLCYELFGELEFKLRKFHPL